MDKRFIVGAVIVLALGAARCSSLSREAGPSEEFKKAVRDFPAASSNTGTQPASGRQQEGDYYYQQQEGDYYYQQQQQEQADEDYRRQQDYYYQQQQDEYYRRQQDY
jgi:Sec-independent protein translocase protein TatA